MQTQCFHSLGKYGRLRYHLSVHDCIHKRRSRSLAGYTGRFGERPPRTTAERRCRDDHLRGSPRSRPSLRSTTSCPAPVPAVARPVYLAISCLSCLQRWPKNDKSTVQKWRLKVDVLASEDTKPNLYMPLPIVNAMLILDWNTSTNVMKIDRQVTVAIPDQP